MTDRLRNRAPPRLRTQAQDLCKQETKKGKKSMNEEPKAERLKVTEDDSWYEVYARCLLLSEKTGEEPLSIIAREMPHAAEAEDETRLRLLLAALNVLLTGRAQTVEPWAHEPGPTREELLEERREDEVMCYFEVQARENYPLISSQRDEPPYDYRGKIVHDFDRGSLSPVRVQLSGLVNIDTNLDILKHMVTLIEANKYRLEERDSWVENIVWWSKYDCDWPWQSRKAASAPIIVERED